MPLPAGFQLEPTPAPAGIKLPPGFQLETASAADMIPGARQPAPAPDTRTFGQKLLGYAVDVPATVASTLVSGIPMLTGAATSALMGKGPEPGMQAVAEQLQYRPRTPEGEAAQEFIGKIASGLPPVLGMGNLPGAAMTAAGPAARTVGGAIKSEAQGIKELIAPQAAREAAQQAKIVRSYKNASVIDTANLARKYDIAVNPMVTNPSAANRLTAVLAGTETMDPYFSAQNAPKWSTAIKRDLGVGAQTQLKPEVYDAKIAEASKAYDPVKNVVMRPNDEIVSQIESLRIAPTIGGEGAAAAVNSLLDNAQTLLSQGRRGAEVLNDIRQLRRNANSIYQSQKAGMAPDPAKMAVAETSTRLANALDLLIDNNVSDSKTLTAIQSARKRIAQINDFERATDPITGLVDPQEFAKMLREGKPLSGTAADLGQIAGMFPQIANVSPGAIARGPSLQRGGVGGVIGAATGGAVGGPLGAAVGMGVGGTVGAGVRPFMARRIGSAKYQAARAMPPDYRPPANMLRPVEPTPRGAPNQLVPYQASEVLMPGEPYQPNWTFGQPTPEVRVSPPPVGAPQLPAPSPEATLATLRAEDVRRAGVSRAIGREAEARQAAAEAAARQPTRGGSLYELDPVTGRLREVSQGVKGATPETFRNYGAELQSAAEKVTAGRRFDLTAAEKVAWERTKVDLAEVTPGAKALSEKAIAEKMLDRAWVEQTAVKAREKAAAFDEIAARAKNERARQAAAANRERMLDLAESMEDRLREPRPVSLGGQGPKTREAIRNRLMGGENQNALAR